MAGIGKIALSRKSAYDNISKGQDRSGQIAYDMGNQKRSEFVSIGQQILGHMGTAAGAYKEKQESWEQFDLGVEKAEVTLPEQTFKQKAGRILGITSPNLKSTYESGDTLFSGAELMNIGQKAKLGTLESSLVKEGGGKYDINEMWGNKLKTDPTSDGGDGNIELKRLTRFAEEHPKLYDEYKAGLDNQSGSSTSGVGDDEYVNPEFLFDDGSGNETYDNFQSDGESTKTTIPEILPDQPERPNVSIDPITDGEELGLPNEVLDPFHEPEVLDPFYESQTKTIPPKEEKTSSANLFSSQALSGADTTGLESGGGIDVLPASQSDGKVNWYKDDGSTGTVDSGLELESMKGLPSAMIGMPGDSTANEPSTTDEGGSPFTWDLFNDDDKHVPFYKQGK